MVWCCGSVLWVGEILSDVRVCWLENASVREVHYPARLQTKPDLKRVFTTHQHLVQPVSWHQVRQLVAVFLRQLQSCLHDGGQVGQVAAVRCVRVVADSVFRRQLAARNDTTFPEVFFHIHHRSHGRQVEKPSCNNTAGFLDGSNCAFTGRLDFNVHTRCELICTLATRCRSPLDTSVTRHSKIRTWRSTHRFQKHACFVANKNLQSVCTAVNGPAVNLNYELI